MFTVIRAAPTADDAERNIERIDARQHQKKLPGISRDGRGAAPHQAVKSRSGLRCEREASDVDSRRTNNGFFTAKGAPQKHSTPSGKRTGGLPRDEIFVLPQAIDPA
jgi:hypothetical protein